MIRTNDNRELSVIELGWDELIEKLQIVSPVLAGVMDKLKVNVNRYTFYLASYCFGATIISNQKTYLPLKDGNVIAFDSAQLPDAIRNNLQYNPSIEDPLGMVLNKTSEFYLLGENSIQPQSIIKSGQMFGIARAVDNSPSTSSILDTNLNAGSRSIFMLSKISDKINHNKIKQQYAIKSAPPSSPREHWQVFVELSRKISSSWRSEVIYFPRNWIKELSTEQWASLELCLIQMHRKSYSMWHKVSSIWDKIFQDIEEVKNLKKYYSMQSLVTARQLFKIAADIVPGFRPAIDDESAPIHEITQVYSNVYNKWARPKYSPIIMEPCKISSCLGEAVYDSLNHATFTKNHLESSGKKSHITLLSEVQMVTNAYIKGILDNKSDIKVLSNIAKTVIFDYYHTSPENYNHINNVMSLQSEDKRFRVNEHEEFPNNAQFFKGCIKISVR